MSATARPLWTSTEAASATGGEAAAPWAATGVSIDSRNVEAGDLFVALEGERQDGHAFVAQAFARSAAAAMVARRSHPPSPQGPLLLVVDTFEGLCALAARARARSAARIVAVTGSVGKTGTKELLAAALASDGPTGANFGNLNNRFGAPLSLARLPADAAYGVFELGMNHPGEIAPLSRLVRPHIALITTVAGVHTAMFDSLDGIADAKAEIFEGLEAGGTAVLNRDNAYFERLVRAALAHGAGRIVSFGEARASDARLLDWRPDDRGGRVSAALGERRIDYRISLAGRHWALNSVAALAAATAAGASLERAAEALASVAPLPGRGTHHRIVLPDGDCELIDESYNASPVSVRAALKTLAAARPTPSSGRRVAVLGDMLELGADEAELHAGLAADVAEAGIDLVFTAGDLAAHLHHALAPRCRGAHAPDAESLTAPLLDALRAGDVVMVKGSLGSRMGRVVERLLEAGTAAGGPA